MRTSQLIIHKLEIPKSLYMKKLISKIAGTTAAVLLLATAANAQLTIDGQVISRGEYRHGFKSLVTSANQPAAFFIEQRSRIKFGYNSEKIKTCFSVQDVRVWGDTAQLTRTDGKTMFHEAWGEYAFNKKFSARFGRQELDYDDARILGNVDWTMQARSHDAMLLIYKDSLNTFHAGFAYNQMKDQMNTTLYTSPNNYKTLTYFWFNRALSKSMGLSVLYLINGKQFNYTNFQGVLNSHTEFSHTAGFRYSYKTEKIKANLAAYTQFGRDNAMTSVAADSIAKKISAMYGAFDITYMATKAIGITLGGEYLSGQSETDTSKAYREVSHAFNPFYGTNHKFNGYMDYFYVGNHINSVGLIDPYVRVKYSVEKYWVAVDAHYFMAAADVRDDSVTTSIAATDPALAMEIDLTVNYMLTKGCNLQFGYSHMLANENLEKLRNGGKSGELNHWAYLMIVFKPTLYKQN